MIELVSRYSEREKLSRLAEQSVKLHSLRTLILMAKIPGFQRHIERLVQACLAEQGRRQADSDGNSVSVKVAEGGR